MSYSLVIFDFDGTLVDSERCVHAAMDAAFRDLGIRADLSRLKRQIGMPLDQSVRRLAEVDLDDRIVSELIDVYRRYHGELQHDLIRPYAGVVPALQRLASGGVTLAIASSKLSSAVRQTLAQFGIEPLFPVLVGGEEVVRGKPDPEMVDRVLRALDHAAADALVVGDTTYDVAMAHNAGLDSCAVTYGNQSREEILTSRPTYVADSIDEVVRVALTRPAP
jgi:phosphoglycolate phosphatase